MGNKSYKWNAKGYEDHSTPQQEWAHELISKLNLKGSERVLDIGCGEGKVTVDIAAALSNGSVVGIDSSGEMIDLARNKYPEKDYQNISFRQENASNLPFENEFDVVFSNATLHWIHDHHPVLQGISKSLKPNGKILLQMGGKGNGAEIIKAANKIIKSNKWQRYFTDFKSAWAFYEPEEYKSWVKEADLHPVRAELIPKDMVHKNPEALASWLESVFLPYLDRVPNSKRKSFINEVIEKYLEDHPVDKEGQTHVRMVRLEVEALKEK